ncbi:type II secretion system F family protein [Patescibacteria group bacterium]|nr:type II secretion system F family protein [Patescibacteria group bacterium]
MIRAGLDVKKALVALERQAKNKQLKEAIGGIKNSIDRGTTLADGMSFYPVVFPPIFISMVRVGEATGKLEETLKLLAIQLQKEYELKRAVRGGLLYPAVIMTAIVAVSIAMLVFVIPKLAEIFEGFEVDLPLTTRVLLSFGSFFEVYWWLVIIGLVLLVAGIRGLLKVKAVKDMVMQVFLYVPIIGKIMRQVNLGRFARNLSSLLQSGVSYVDALRLLGANTPHGSYAKVYLEAAEYVQKGQLLSQFLIRHERLFPPLVVSVIEVGEETGSMAEVLLEIAQFYESEVDQVMKNMASVMEPFLMIVIGLVVGTLAVSVISPIYSLVNVI